MSKISDKFKDVKNAAIARGLVSFGTGKLKKFLSGIPRLHADSDIVVMLEPENSKTLVHIVELGNQDGMLYVRNNCKTYDAAELVKELLGALQSAGVNLDNLNSFENEQIERNER
jgi:reverse gyrase